jgi:hypothetical protein
MGIFFFWRVIGIDNRRFFREAKAPTKLDPKLVE